MMMMMKESVSCVLSRLREAKLVIERNQQKGRKKRKLVQEDHPWEDESQSDEKRRKLVHPLLRLDAMGRPIDEDGKLVAPQSCLISLKVNINNHQKRKKDVAAAAASQFDDPRVGMQMQGIHTNLPRRRRPTLILSLDQTISVRRRSSQFEQVAKPKDEAEPPKEPSSSIPVPHADVVDVEWWDVPFLQQKEEEEENMNTKKMITIYVEHPRPTEPPAGSEAAPPPPQLLKLTNHERKKLRTQKRVARQKDIQQMIRLGVLEPPKPRLKLTNVMKLGTGKQDPTRLEMEIRRAADEREQAHMDRNIARKLTPDELRQKKTRKLFDHHSMSSNTVVSVYKLMNMDLSRHPQARFKVDINAQQNSLTGCAAIISDKVCISSVVVVEGCTKSIKRFRRLMLERIDWTVAMDEYEDKDENVDENKCKCVLVWEGSVATPSFTSFVVQGCTTQAAACKFFSDHGVAHYFHLVQYSDQRSHPLG